MNTTAEDILHEVQSIYKTKLPRRDPEALDILLARIAAVQDAAQAHIHEKVRVADDSGCSVLTIGELISGSSSHFTTFVGAVRRARSRIQ